MSSLLSNGTDPSVPLSIAELAAKSNSVTVKTHTANPLLMALVLVAKATRVKTPASDLAVVSMSTVAQDPTFAVLPTVFRSLATAMLLQATHLLL